MVKLDHPKPHIMQAFQFIIILELVLASIAEVMFYIFVAEGRWITNAELGRADSD